MSIRSVVGDIWEAGLDGRVSETQVGLRIEVRIPGTKFCVGGIIPADEGAHKQFTKGLIDKVRTDALRIQAGMPYERGKVEHVSRSEINLVERGN